MEQRRLAVSVNSSVINESKATIGVNSKSVNQGEMIIKGSANFENEST